MDVGNQGFGADEVTRLEKPRRRKWAKLKRHLRDWLYSLTQLVAKPVPPTEIDHEVEWAAAEKYAMNNWQRDYDRQ